MSRFATGVAVISTMAEGRVHAMTANAFMSGSLEPPLCLVSVAKRARTHKRVLDTGHFGVSMLAHDQERQSAHFGGWPDPALAVAFDFVGATPILRAALARIAATTVAVHECGDHSLFIGRIDFLDSRAGEPLVFFNGRYASLVSEQPAPEADPFALNFW